MDFISAVILGIVEGLTEFLPISSTGHLLVAIALLNFPQSLVGGTPQQIAVFRDSFAIFIQFGAVLAVLVYYGRSLLQQAQRLSSDRNVQRFWLNIFIAFLPAAVLGLLFQKKIDEVLSDPKTVGIVVGLALFLGGIVFLLIERGPHEANIRDVEKVTPLQAFLIGIAQAVALIPGVSRSGATIIGGLLLGLDRMTATTFSFYLFIPTLGAATLYKLFSSLRAHDVTASQLPLFGVGTVVAFGVSYASIVWMLRYISTHSFRAFGIYRIIAGIAIIALALFTSLLR
jgi:undecaprenyl-diphosphatase